MVKWEGVYELGGKGTLSRPTRNPHYEDDFQAWPNDSHLSQDIRISVTFTIYCHSDLLITVHTD